MTCGFNFNLYFLSLFDFAVDDTINESLYLIKNDFASSITPEKDYMSGPPVYDGTPFHCRGDSTGPPPVYDFTPVRPGITDPSNTIPSVAVDLATSSAAANVTPTNAVLGICIIVFNSFMIENFFHCRGESTGRPVIYFEFCSSRYHGCF